MKYVVVHSFDCGRKFVDGGYYDNIEEAGNARKNALKSVGRFEDVFVVSEDELYNYVKPRKLFRDMI